ncbi:HAD family hydrolase [Streptosporangium saharense]|uniref:HAD superfamily hydrolase (TIGR01509 family) n=1 Tax=Streptosporangium saharense TaxID=1706840 RepID=A0A7W7QNN9_9ACTN|nr:HAD hydrolase-like protein [Streptosporangium saharense]MBB4916960.1 HAD superfamily hydrolase (TIGR01509 family) [Streptosporangium saharense]
MTARTAAHAVRHARHLLLDFDGPICDIFAGLPAPEVAASLRELLAASGVDLPLSIREQDDPMEVFRFSAGLGKGLNHAVLKALTKWEMKATETSRPTPGAVELIRQARHAGRSVTIVSNNSVDAVTAYLTRHDLLMDVDHISARADADPELMKPHPHLVQQALAWLGAIPSESVLIGDSESDMEVCKRTGVVAVGYANKPGKVERLKQAGADYVVTTIHDLLGAS